MKNVLVELITTLMVFLIIKLIIALLYKIIDKLFNIPKENMRRFDFFSSLGMMILFIYLWLMSVATANETLEITNLEAYISFCFIGFFIVLWCYFSWDAESILVKPRLSEKEERRLKKIVIYLMILIFVIAQGYQQTLHSMDDNYSVNVLFSVTNYSIIVAAIAFDRLLNQVFNI